VLKLTIMIFWYWAVCSCRILERAIGRQQGIGEVTQDIVQNDHKVLTCVTRQQFERKLAPSAAFQPVHPLTNLLLAAPLH
jgi:hypothetical protein